MRTTPRNGFGAIPVLLGDGISFCHSKFGDPAPLAFRPRQSIAEFLPAISEEGRSCLNRDQRTPTSRAKELQNPSRLSIRGATTQGRVQAQLRCPRFFRLVQRVLTQPCALFRETISLCFQTWFSLRQKLFACASPSNRTCEYGALVFVAGLVVPSPIHPHHRQTRNAAPSTFLANQIGTSPH
jgi:hypothetical protein